MPLSKEFTSRGHSFPLHLFSTNKKSRVKDSAQQATT